MTTLKQGWFHTRYKSYRCPKCDAFIGQDVKAYRIGTVVYCGNCGPKVGSKENPPEDLPRPKRQPKVKKVALPDPTKGQGAMPGENVAQKCADGVYRYEFDSVTEAVRDGLDDYAQNDSNAEFIRKRQEYALGGKDSWANHFTRSRFLKELSNPSKRLLDAVDQMRQKLLGEVAAPDAPRRRIRRGQEWGEELDADRWLVRDLSPWERSVRESQPRKTVTIGCNLSVNANAKPHELLYRGAAALALADILTSRGVNVGIVLFYTATDVTSTVKRAVVRYSVKDHLMPLDVSAVAFAMCEIAFFRVIGALGSPRHFTGQLNESLGRAANLPAADRQSIDFLVDADVLGEQAAENWLRGCLAGSEKEVCHV